MVQKKVITTMAALAFGAAATTATADDISLVQSPAGLLSSPSTSLSFPGMFGVPTAVAAKGGTGFVGLTYVNPRGGFAGAGGDASVSAGYTIGNPVDTVSVTFGVSFTGTQPFADAGSFSVSASRLLQAGGTSATFVGASVSKLGTWGNGPIPDPNYSVYVSHLAGFQAGDVEIPVQFVVGYGSNNTQTNGNAPGVGILENGAFAGVGMGLTKSLSGSVSFTRAQMNTGLTVSVPNTSMSASVGIFDVTDNTNRRQLSVSVGFGF